MSSNLSSPEPENDNDVLLEDEDHELASGNGKLAIIVGIILLVAVLGYALVPAKTAKSAISSVMPSVVLGDATVTGSRPAEEAAAAPTEEVQPEATKKADAATLAAKPNAHPVATAAAPAAHPTEAPQPAAPAAVAEVAPAPAAPAAPAEPASVTMSGRILDEDGHPLAGATVLVKGSRKGTGTDANGNYTLEVPAGENTLVYGYGGYQDQEMHASGSKPVNVTLVPREGSKRRRK